MMRALLAAALVAVAIPANAAVTVTRWQDFGPYIAEQTRLIAAQKAEIAALKKDMVDVIHDIGVLRYAHQIDVEFFRDQACRVNAKIAAGGWASILIGLEPTPLGSYVCPSPMPTTPIIVPFIITDAPQ